MTTIFSAAFLILLSATQPAMAAPTPSPTPEEEKLNPPLIERNIELSKQIDNVATGVDVGLTGKKTVDTDNKTRITIRNQVIWGEGGAFSYMPHLDLRLHLPNLEKKWRLKFSTYDEDEENRGVNRNRLKIAPIRRNYGGTVGLAQKLGNVNVEFEPRIEYREHLEVSYFLKFKSAAESPGLVIRPEVHLFARADSGVGEFISVNFDFPLTSSLVLTTINEEQYMDRVNLFSANNGVRLSYDFSEKLTQGFSVMLESSSRPNYHLDRYTLATGFTHKLYMNVLHYTVVPFLAFLRSENFKGAPGLNLEFNLIF